MFSLLQWHCCGPIAWSILSHNLYIFMQIELDSAAVQLTPFGQSLVLFNSVIAPSCRLHFHLRQKCLVFSLFFGCSIDEC